ncbi:MAG: putative monovalent cation/H+ antiporter subunit A [Candidatus Abyssobacteria bacterium SURF_17]|uniref:Putative monovalent cation/H+ antiporter subunit A n=1 Tax=Candidatus Abyssobacteria bacterium SURF_17 TaxID=2093361 RepID=A0A419F7U8_9BACT|nr:MAG: putative monovalent cation/H+ antiporter subunit A [Candidatus Abyssubacteria bacterium SURF_17]
MLIAVVSGFVFSLAVPLLHRTVRNVTDWLVVLLPFSLFIYFSFLTQPIAAGGVLSSSHAWAPSVGVNLSFVLDGLSLLFAILISGIGALVFLYSSGYFKGHSGLGRFYAYLLIFMASMLGLVLSDNVIALFIFWELTSLSSYLLIGFDHERSSARSAARQALLVTSVGGLALLAGLLLLGEAGGSFELSQLLREREAIRSHRFYVPIVVLIMVAAFTKSAQFPFHFWLPNAMEAPAPVSTYLHSATMVKAGIYLLARLSPVLGGARIWQGTIVVVGAITMLIGACLAIKETDIKRILAYSTVSILGVLTFLLGLGTRAAVEAAVAYLFIHALYKAGLFLVAGIIDHETGIRDVTRLSGLARIMPVTALAAAVAGLSMAGLPPLFGFIGKELLYTATLQAPLANSILTAAVLLTSALLVAVAGIVSLGPFIGRTMTLSEKHGGVPLTMTAGPVVLAGLGLLIGLLPNLVAGRIVSSAVGAVLAQPAAIKLALLHGLTVQLGLSGLTFALGVTAYLRRDALRRAVSRFDLGTALGPAKGYSLTLDGMTALARLQTRILQSGHLHIYLFIILAVTVGLVGSWLVRYYGLMRLEGWADIRFYEFLTALVIVAATIVIVRASSRLFSVVALGVVGYSMGIIYIIFGAPDLAMTQFSIDTLTVILLLLVLYRLPRYARYSTTLERLRDAAIALAVGVLVTGLTLAATAVPPISQISSYFAENSYLLAKGRNVVNVILVDFRAFDTLGEITVLAVAAIGVYSLMKLRGNGSDG